MKRILIFSIVVVMFTACASTGSVDYAQIAESGEDVFAGKNWNAPRRNNMYDRWEFRTDGTFHFIHVHEGRPLDRGNYRYNINNGTINITKEGEENVTVYTYKFKGNAFTLKLVPSETTRSSGGYQMGALPEDTETFTHAK